jgi:hypothetical protein
MSAPFLLCEFHAHTTWSDGELSLRELVDLYGGAGFDVLCVTDHTHPADDPWVHLGVRPEALSAYFREIEEQAERARSLYGLVLLPGLELTDNAADPDDASHALAVGLSRTVTMERGILSAMAAANAFGAAIVAAHPAGPESVGPGVTRRFWCERATFVDVVHRWELINGHTAFPWIAEARLQVVANGDFHRTEHLASWKTLLPCEKSEEAIVDFLRSPARAHLTIFDPVSRQLAA